MGKAAERRKARRSVFLKELAEKNPERFRHEWAKRIESWADDIWASAKSGMIDTPPVFSIADRAKEVLEGCGKQAKSLQIKETNDVLNNECCRALAPHIGQEIYTIGQSKGLEMAELYRRRKKKTIEKGKA